MGLITAIVMALNPRPFGDSQRMMTWAVAARAFTERPIIGIGPDCILPYFDRLKPGGMGHERAADAHNDILEVAATTGMIGLIAYLWLAGNTFSVLRGPALGSMAALFLNAKFSPVELEVLVLAAVIVGAYES